MQRGNHGYKNLIEHLVAFGLTGRSSYIRNCFTERVPDMISKLTGISRLMHIRHWMD